MLAASDGDLWIISTPNGRRGFFYDTWTSPGNLWTRISVPAHDCPRISKVFLAEESRIMSERKFRQEYLCEFLDSDDAFFSSQFIELALAPIPPLNLSYVSSVNPSISMPFKYAGIPDFFIGVDLGQKHDFTAVCILEKASVLDGPRCLVTYEFPKKTIYVIRHL